MDSLDEFIDLTQQTLLNDGTLDHICAQLKAVVVDTIMKNKIAKSTNFAKPVSAANFCSENYGTESLSLVRDLLCSLKLQRTLAVFESEMELEEYTSRDKLQSDVGLGKERVNMSTPLLTVLVTQLLSGNFSSTVKQKSPSSSPYRQGSPSPTKQQGSPSPTKQSPLPSPPKKSSPFYADVKEESFDDYDDFDDYNLNDYAANPPSPKPTATVPEVSAYGSSPSSLPSIAQNNPSSSYEPSPFYESSKGTDADSAHMNESLDDILSEIEESVDEIEEVNISKTSHHSSHHSTESNYLSFGGGKEDDNKDDMDEYDFGNDDHDFNDDVPAKSLSGTKIQSSFPTLKQDKGLDTSSSPNKGVTLDTAHDNNGIENSYAENDIEEFEEIEEVPEVCSDSDADSYSENLKNEVSVDELNTSAASIVSYSTLGSRHSTPTHTRARSPLQSHSWSPAEKTSSSASPGSPTKKRDSLELSDSFAESGDYNSSYRDSSPRIHRDEPDDRLEQADMSQDFGNEHVGQDKCDSFDGSTSLNQEENIQHDQELMHDQHKDAGRAGEDSSDYGDDFDDLEESVPSEVEDDLSFGGEDNQDDEGDDDDYFNVNSNVNENLTLDTDGLEETRQLAEVEKKIASMKASDVNHELPSDEENDKQDESDDYDPYDDDFNYSGSKTPVNSPPRQDKSTLPPIQLDDDYEDDIIEEFEESIASEDDMDEFETSNNDNDGGNGDFQSFLNDDDDDSFDGSSKKKTSFFGKEKNTKSGSLFGNSRANTFSSNDSVQSQSSQSSIDFSVSENEISGSHVLGNVGGDYMTHAMPPTVTSASTKRTSNW